ncbi:hypothetical protein CK621_14995, partial [Vandammella animalimorsus]
MWPLAFAHPAWAEVPHLHEAGDADDPVAQITAPASSEQISVATISSPTDVVGTASDAHLASWQLLISPAGQNQWSELAQGSS